MNGVLLVIVVFQLVQLPGAMLMETPMALATVLLGLALCAVAFVFIQFGKLTVVGILLILVVDLGCGLMLLTSSFGMGMGMGMSMGLGVADLPVLDLLIISELIAVSLLPPASVFLVGLSNILFIVAVFAFVPRSPELNMFMNSSMAYNAVMQPLIDAAEPRAHTKAHPRPQQPPERLPRMPSGFQSEAGVIIRVSERSPAPQLLHLAQPA